MIEEASLDEFLDQQFRRCYVTILYADGSDDGGKYGDSTIRAWMLDLKANYPRFNDIVSIEFNDKDLDQMCTWQRESGMWECKYSDWSYTSSTERRASGVWSP
jgi:hypothetical protein